MGTFLAGRYTAIGDTVVDGVRIVDIDFSVGAAARFVEEDGLSMTVGEAERTRVKLRGWGHKVPLVFIAKHFPAKLDALLERATPGSRLFYALVLLCDKYEQQVAAAVSSRNAAIWGRAKRTMGSTSLSRVPLVY